MEVRRNSLEGPLQPLPGLFQKSAVKVISFHRQTSDDKTQCTYIDQTDNIDLPLVNMLCVLDWNSRQQFNHSIISTHRGIKHYLAQI